MKKKTETTAVQSIRNFNKAMNLMESIAEAGVKDYMTESASQISEETISNGEKANWVELTKVEGAALHESFEPRFAQRTESLNDDEKVSVAATMKKYLAESTGDVINLNRLPGMSVVIANDTGLSPVAVEDYIDNLINQSPADRDSQQKSHDLTGRVDGAAGDATTPEDGMFPGSAEEGMTGMGEPEVMPMSDDSGIPEINDTIVDELPEMDAPVDTDIGSEDGFDAELSALDAELSEELSDDAELPMGDENELPVADEGELPIDGELPGEDELPIDDAELDSEDELPIGDEDAIIEEDESDEEDSFMESVTSKKSELAAIKAKFESSELKAKFESIVPKYEAIARKKSEIIVSAKLESIASGINAEANVKSKLESISAKINSGALLEAETPSTKMLSAQDKAIADVMKKLGISKKDAEKELTSDEDKKVDVGAKLESIREELAFKENRNTQLESIRTSLFESVNSKKKNLTESSDDSRKMEIAAGLTKLKTQLESCAAPSETVTLSRAEKLANLKAKFESAAADEFNASEKERLG